MIEGLPAHYGPARALSATLQAHLAKQVSSDPGASSSAFLLEYAPELATAAQLGSAATATVCIDLLVDLSEALMSVTEYVAGKTGQTTVELLSELVRTYRKSYPHE